MTDEHVSVVMQILIILALAGCSSSAGGGPCEGVSCSDHGVCIDHGGSPVCACVRGYHPVFLACVADDAADPCAGVDCSSHGMCRVEDGFPTCDCDDGFATPSESDLLCLETAPSDADARFNDDGGPDGRADDAVPEVEGEGDSTEIPRDATDEGVNCTPHSYRQCAGGNVTWFNNCGEPEDVAEECADPNGECYDISPTDAACRCRTHWEGPACDVCPPFWDAAADCDACIGRYLPAMDCSACAIYVDVSAGTGGTGMSWASAFSDLQAGIDAAESEGCEVWVRRGTYFAYRTSTLDTFQLRPAVAVYGGFAGAETSRDARDPVANVTILEGQNGSNYAEHVVTGAEGAILDGFTVQHGRSLICDVMTDGHVSCGAGVLQMVAGTLTLANMRFLDNRTSQSYDCGCGGAAVFVYQWAGVSNLIVSDSTFEGNISAYGGGAIYGDDSVEIRRSTFRNNSAAGPTTDADGGAVFARGSLVIEDSVFTSNTAAGSIAGYETYGGAVFASSGPVTIRRCSFSGNGATWRGSGGGVYLREPGTGSIIENSLFAGNSATASGPSFGEGGGLFCGNGCTYLTIVNTTFYGNSARLGGGIRARLGGSPTLTNSIVWNNTLEGVSGTITYTDLSPGLLGTGNIEAEPRFVDAAGGDFHLLSDSPCIDAANGPAAPAADRDGLPRVDAPTADTGVGPPWADMGAFEYQP